MWFNHAELEAKIKKAASDDEWKDIEGKAEKLQVWRIVCYAVVSWPKPLHGHFYEGDSYVILQKLPTARCYDVHFWIGKNSNPDDYATAAYKAVELCAILFGNAVLHREMMDYESELLLSYFPNGFRILKGGLAAGLKYMSPSHFQLEPHLYRLKTTKTNLILREVTLSRQSMNSGDVFILDIGHRAWQWNGKESGLHERCQGGEILRNLVKDRNGRVTLTTLEEGQDAEGFDPEFCKYLPTHVVGLGGRRAYLRTRPKPASIDERQSLEFTPTLYRLTDDTQGKRFKRIVSEDCINKAYLVSSGIFVLDSGQHVFVWVGQWTTCDHRRALSYAHAYLREANRPPSLPVTLLVEGQQNSDFERFWDDSEIDACRPINDSYPACKCACVIC